jgi:tetratricopeptide (TPR) repeat protein
VGDVQGGFRSSNLGDTAGFIASYRKALAIREAVWRGDPGNAESERELFQTHLRLSDALMATGDLKGSVDQVKQMLPVAEKLSATDPNNLTNRRILASAHLDYGWKRSGLGDWKGGLQDCREAATMLESIVAPDPSDKRTRRILAIAYERVAELLSTYEGRHAESLAMEQKALAVEEELLRQAPRNTDIERLKAWDTMRLGEEILAGGDLSRALAKYGDALNQFQALSDADPKSVQFHNDVAAVLGRIGAAHLTQGNAKLAVADFERSLAQIDSVSRTGALDIDALEIKAQGQFRLAGAYERAGQRREAALWFERSIPSLKLACDRNGPRSVDEAVMLAEARSKVAAIR